VVINPVFIVLIAVLAIFVVMVVPAWLYLRLVTVITDISIVNANVARQKQDIDNFLTMLNTQQNRLTKISADIEIASARDISTQETIRSLSNKMNSRVREERKKQVETVDLDEQTERSNEVQEEIDFSKIGFPVLDQSQQAAPSQPLKRKFGVIP
jgi:hypothetical protein